MILALKTDTAEAQILLLSNAGNQITENTWMAGRELSKVLLTRIENLMEKESVKWADLTGLIVYHGPGSFTGLRIGATVANTIAFVQSVPIAGIGGDDWVQNGITRLQNNDVDVQVIPHYGAPANVTRPGRRP